MTLCNVNQYIKYKGDFSEILQVVRKCVLTIMYIVNVSRETLTMRVCQFVSRETVAYISRCI